LNPDTKPVRVLDSGYIHMGDLAFVVNDASDVIHNLT